MSTEESAPEKKKRSPVERAIVWGLIVLLGIAVALEYRGMTGYSQTLDALETRFDETRGQDPYTFTLTEAKSLATMAPSFSQPAEDGSRTESVAKWFTLLRFLPGRKYDIHLGLTDTTEKAGITSITTAADRELEESVLEGAPLAANDGGPSPTDATDPPAGGQSAEPPAGNGGSGRPQRPGSTDGDGNNGGRRETAAAGSGVNLGIVGELFKPEVQQKLGLSDEQIASVLDLQVSVQNDVKEVASAGLRTIADQQQVVDDFIVNWTKDVEKIISEDGVAELKKLVDKPE